MEPRCLLSIGDVLSSFMDTQLQNIQQGLNNNIFSQKLPFLADGLGSPFPDANGSIIDDAGQFIDNFRATFAGSMSGDTTPAQIVSDIDSLMGPSDLNLESQSSQFYQDPSGSVTFNVFLHQALTPSSSAELFGGIGLPGLPISVPGSETTLDMSVGFDFTLVFGIDANGNPFFNDSNNISTDSGETFASQLSVTIGASFPEGTSFGVTVGDPNTFALTGTLTDNPDDPSFFFGTFYVQLADDANGNAGVPSATFSGGVEGHFKLSAGFDQSNATPSDWPINLQLLSDIHIQWSFSGAVVGQPIADFGDTPTVEFNNVQLDLGPFFGEFVAPLVQRLQSVTEGLQPVADFFNSDIPGISDFSQQCGSSEITYLDALNLYLTLRGDSSAVDSVGNFISAIDAVNNLSVPDGNGLVDLGSFTLTDTRQTDAGIDTENGPQTPPQDQISGSFLSDAENAGLSFPVLDNPEGDFGLFLGQSVPLFNFALPPLDADVTVPYDVQTPIPGLVVHVDLNLTLQAGINLGYDTSGLMKGDPLQGFLISDGLPGSHTIEIDVSGSAGPGVGVPGNAFYIEGGVTGSLVYSLANTDSDGEVHADQLDKEGNVYSVSNGITGSIDAGVEVGGVDVGNVNIGEVDLSHVGGEAADVAHQIEQGFGQAFGLTDMGGIDSNDVDPPGSDDASTEGVTDNAIDPTSGKVQSATVGSAFARPLTVHVKDESGFAKAGVTVTFSAPARGAGITFAGGRTSASVVTDANGNATAPKFTANTVAGTYDVTASTTASQHVAQFVLTNNPGPPTNFSILSGGNQRTPIGTAFAQLLEVEVTDRFGNLTPATVVFSAPRSGASATLKRDAAGTRFNVTATATQVTGSYQVTASATGISARITFDLTNMPAMNTIPAETTTEVRSTSPYSTSSTTFVPIDATNLATSVTLSTSEMVRLDASLALWTAADTRVGLEFLVDGSAPVAPRVFYPAAGGFPTNLFNLEEYVPLSTGTHTVTIAWAALSGTANIWYSGASRTTASLAVSVPTVIPNVGPSESSAEMRSTSVYSTTSTTYVPIDPTNLSISFTLSSAETVRLDACLALWSDASTNVGLEFLVDGSAPVAPRVFFPSLGSLPTNLFNLEEYVPLTAGTHTVAVAWATPFGGTAHIWYGGAGGTTASLAVAMPTVIPKIGPSESLTEMRSTIVYSTASTTYVPIDATNLATSVTLTTPRTVRLDASLALSTAAGSDVGLEFLVDGSAPVAPRAFFPASGGTPTGLFNFEEYVLLSAGTHTVTVAWAALTGTANISYSGAGGTTASLAVAIPNLIPLPTSPHVTSIKSGSRSASGLISVIVSFDEPMNMGSVQNTGGYTVLGAVNKNGRTVYTKPLGFRVTYNPSAMTATIKLSRAYKGAVQVTVKSGIKAANGLSTAKATKPTVVS
jgi:hypothetical protein